MFKDRGLSFVLLDQLTQEDLMNKQLVDHRDEMARQFQKNIQNIYKKKDCMEKVVYLKEVNIQQNFGMFKLVI